MLNRIHSRVLTCLLLTMLLLAAVFTSTYAQEAGTVTIAKPDISAWPQVSTTFTAIDPSGAFIKDLRPGELRVIENNVTIPDYTLEMERVGVRFYVAINEGHSRQPLFRRDAHRPHQDGVVQLDHRPAS